MPRVTSVALSPNGQFVASTGLDGRVRLWNISSNREIDLTASVLAGYGFAVAFSPDGQLLAARGNDEFRNCVRIWRLKGDDPPLMFECDNTRMAASGIAFDSEGSSLAVAYANAAKGRITIWDLQSSQALRTLSHDKAGFSTLAISPEDGMVFAGDQAGMIHRWPSIRGLIEVPGNLNQRRPVQFYAHERARFNVIAKPQ